MVSLNLVRTTTVVVATAAFMATGPPRAWAGFDSATCALDTAAGAGTMKMVVKAKADGEPTKVVRAEVSLSGGESGSEKARDISIALCNECTSLDSGSCPATGTLLFACSDGFELFNASGSGTLVVTKTGTTGSNDLKGISLPQDDGQEITLITSGTPEAAAVPMSAIGTTTYGRKVELCTKVFLPVSV